VGATSHSGHLTDCYYRGYCEACVLMLQSIRGDHKESGTLPAIHPPTHLRLPASEYLTQSLSILSSATCSLGPPWPLQPLGARARPVT
jgi:hypothetical protein